MHMLEVHLFIFNHAKLIMHLTHSHARLLKETEIHVESVHERELMASCMVFQYYNIIIQWMVHGWYTMEHKMSCVAENLR